MKHFRISRAAEKATEKWNSGRAASTSSVSSFNLCTSSGFAAACKTFTGAYKAIRFLPVQEQKTARIYDEDGYCLYR